MGRVKLVVQLFPALREGHRKQDQNVFDLTYTSYAPDYAREAIVFLRAELGSDQLSCRNYAFLVREVESVLSRHIFATICLLPSLTDFDKFSRRAQAETEKNTQKTPIFAGLMI